MVRGLVSFLLIIISISSMAQDVAIGQWRAHLPYNKVVAVAQNGNDLYCGTTEAMFIYHIADGSIDRYSTVNGLSDIGVSTMAFNAVNGRLLIAYSNANMDIFNNGLVTNISDIERTNIVGDKSIYHISFIDELAYLSCGFGIVVLDMSRNEIKDTYYIGPGGSQIRVNATASDGTYIYAATENGVLQADLSSPFLADPAEWTLLTAGIPPGEADAAAFYNGNVYIAADDTAYFWNDTAFVYYHTDAGFSIRSIDASSGYLHISSEADTLTWGRVTVFSTSGIVALDDSAYVLDPRQAITGIGGDLWIADAANGLLRYNSSYEQISPNGPASKGVQEIGVHKGEVWVAAGAVSNIWTYLFSRDGFFRFAGGWWENYAYYSHPELDSILDFVTVAFNEENDHVFMGSYGGGLVEFYNGNIVNVYEGGNSTLQPAAGDPTSYRVGGMTFDEDGNLWVTNFGSPSPISVLTPSGSWKSFTPPSGVDLGGDFVGPIVIDDADQKWIVLPKGKGVLVFWEGDDMNSSSDDRWRVLSTGEGLGNLPDNNVLSIAHDLDGEIWVGTTQGVGVFYCAADVLSSSGCDAERILVQEGEHFAYLMETEFVNTIAVDGADRKWLGTTNGVWLMSSDGTETEARFNEQNSPLLSDNVIDIAIDHESGEVYFGTANGIVSYKGTATKGGDKHDDVYVYPNPVHPGYEGTIAVKGLVKDAYVKITDISGSLIYETRALGGQAVWNGKNYNGERARSGVYLVFSTNQDGSETFVTKFVIVN